MKKNFSALLLGTLGLIATAVAGCHKEAVIEHPKTLDDGIALLRTTLAAASPQAQSNLYSGVIFGLRYGNYGGATLALQRIAADPGLSEQQKQVIKDVGELLKQAAAAQH
jgi:hypothetical protein